MNTRSLWLIAEGLLFALASQMSAAAHGPGVLSAAVNYPVGASPQTIVTGDFNGDGHLDLATGNLVDEIQYAKGTVSVLLGDGAGGFGAAINSDVGANLYTNGDPYWAAFSLTVADFDNDGHFDLAMAIPFQNQETGEFGGVAGISLGNGDGTLRAATYPLFYESVDSVASGDFNNDGNSDLVVTGSAPTLSAGESYGYAQVLLGNGQGGVASSPYVTSFDTNYYELAVGDLNGDGKLDAVGMAGQYGGWGIALLGNGGAGAFSSHNEFSTNGVRSAGVAVGDFTGDGIPDLVVSGGTVEIFTGLGDGTFDEPIVHSANGDEHTGVAVADFNGDGKLDVVTSDGDTSSVSLLLGNGNGALTYAAAYAIGSLPSGVAVGDFNGDGRTDVATANSGSNDVSVLLNQMTLAPPGDFNNDGSIDGADLLKWQGDFGQNANSDADNDNDSDGADFLAWQRQLGAGPSARVASTAVPEPATFVLMIVAAAGWCQRRRRTA